MTSNEQPNSWPDLKPCPFCGGTEEGGDLVMSAHEDEDEQGELLTITTVWCMQCGGEGPTGDTDQEAAEKWNRRASPAPLSYTQVMPGGRASRVFQGINGVLHFGCVQVTITEKEGDQ